MKFIAGNWKLNPSTMREAEMLAGGIVTPPSGNLKTVLLPPAAFLEELAKKFLQFGWGAQDFFYEDTGAFTGEISLSMLKSIGAEYVLVGHSDRRLKFGESDTLVNKKLLAALAEGFSVILCVGELERGKERETTESLKRSTDGVQKEGLAKLTIAYEPVWAISTNVNAEPDDPEHAAEIIAKLRGVLDVSYLYGGSVNSTNVGQFLSRPNIEGALVGGASLKADEFSEILKIAASL